jgi:hypothetical protein
MFIKKRRIRNLNILDSQNGKTIRIGVMVKQDNSNRAERIGFSTSLSVGETILPAIVGPVTGRNSEGYYQIHRDKPKEIWYRTTEWTWKQWSGRGETEEVSDFVDVPYKRYQRTFIPPYAVELTVVKNKNGEKYIVSPTFLCDTSREEKVLLHVINLFLEVFSECYILDESVENITVPKLIRLNWDILPPGDYPWEKRREQIEPFIQKAKPGNQSMVRHRVERIINFGPDFVAIGKAGFSGYLILGFEKRRLYIFESIYTNNATYIFDKDWKEFSLLTKKEILTNDLQKERIIHRKESWENRINELLA